MLLRGAQDQDQARVVGGSGSSPRARPTAALRAAPNTREDLVASIDWRILTRSSPSLSLSLVGRCPGPGNSRSAGASSRRASEHPSALVGPGNGPVGSAFLTQSEARTHSEPPPAKTKLQQRSATRSHPPTTMARRSALHGVVVAASAALAALLLVAMMPTVRVCAAWNAPYAMGQHGMRQTQCRLRPLLQLRSS